MYLVHFVWTAAKLGRPLVQLALSSDVSDLQPAPIAPSRKALGRAYVPWRTAEAVKRAHAVLCDSEQIRRSLETCVPGTRVEIVPIGVELNGDASSGRQWRSQSAIPGDAFVLFSCRLFSSIFNILTIIRAFAKVREAIPECVLILKHLQFMGDDVYRSACLQLIDELGIGEAVRHVRELERAYLLALYRAAHVVVTVPTNDATAVSLLEAMAASVPVVASRTGGLDAAILRDGETALLVTPDYLVGLADAITRLHGSSALRVELVAEVQMTVSLDRRLRAGDRSGGGALQLARQASVIVRRVGASRSRAMGAAAVSRIDLRGVQTKTPRAQILQRPRSRASTERCSQRGISSHLLQALHQGRLLTRRQELARIADHFGGTRAICRDHRHRSCHLLERANHIPSCSYSCSIISAAPIWKVSSALERSALPSLAFISFSLSSLYLGACESKH